MYILLNRRPFSQPKQYQDPDDQCTHAKNGDGDQERIVCTHVQGAFDGPTQLGLTHNSHNLLHKSPLMLGKKPPFIENRFSLGAATRQRWVIASILVAVEEKNLVYRVNLGLCHELDEKQVVHIGERFVERVEGQGCQVRIAPVNAEDRRNNPTLPEIAPHIGQRESPRA